MVVLVRGNGCCMCKREWLLYWWEGGVVVLVGGSGCCIDVTEWLL